MIKKYPHPSGKGSGVVVDIKDFRKPNTITCPVFRVQGWLRVCIRCREPFILSYVCGTIRDGRQKLCHLCLATGGVQ